MASSRRHWLKLGWTMWKLIPSISMCVCVCVCVCATLRGTLPLVGASKKAHVEIIASHWRNTKRANRSVGKKASGHTQGLVGRELPRAKVYFVFCLCGSGRRT